MADLSSPGKRSSEEVVEGAPKKIKNNTIHEADPAFSFGSTQETRESSSLSQPHNDGFSADIPTPFDNIAEQDAPPGNSSTASNLSKAPSTTGFDGLALPKSLAPTTNLQKTDTSSKKANDILPNKSGKIEKKATPAASKTDTNKMQDILFSAGVDIKEEEALLNNSINASKTQIANDKAKTVQIPNHPPFLHPDQVASFMKKICKDQNLNQNFNKNPEILKMMSTACEMYIRDVITNTIVISRHRRKGVKVNSGRRSDVSIALKTIATQEKKEEERRVKKRVALGLEKEDYENKLGSEETLHRASNATAGLRAGTKKQYGWLKKSMNNPAAIGSKTYGKVAGEVVARGDNGLRFREAREEPGIVMRDLLYALENRRIGVHTVITKGYARLRD